MNNQYYLCDKFIKNKIEFTSFCKIKILTTLYFLLQNESNSLWKPISGGWRAPFTSCVRNRLFSLVVNSCQLLHSSRTASHRVHLSACNVVLTTKTIDVKTHSTLVLSTNINCSSLPLVCVVLKTLFHGPWALRSSQIPRFYDSIRTVKGRKVADPICHSEEAVSLTMHSRSKALSKDSSFSKVSIWSRVTIVPRSSWRCERITRFFENKNYT